ncbi:hypothetical protein FB45DRAFT_864679 [Roridomyces roridus]|uniref:Uncharacterized protein n=1 Tax=Roridomyces roridus TaxID=1738132 RepID=A0AAD7FT44_9AGAR|nr:hypothetical protein FB45DRAFT_864679 [Roridomyces roridus]
MSDSTVVHPKVENHRRHQRFSCPPQRGLIHVIQLAVDKVLQRTQFDAAGAQAMRECVVPLWPDVVGDGGIVREARILSRIYSPTNPAAIDVHLNYWTRTRWTYCEFWYTVYYRLHPVISTERVDTSTPQGFDEMNNFRVLLEIALKDIPPGPKWRAVEKRKFHIDSSDANSARWLGKNIRRVLGEAVERDKQDEQDWDEDPEDSDEDSDEDEDE